MQYHSHPGRSDEALWEPYSYGYTWDPIGTDEQDRQCYSFNIKNITLMTTLDRNGAGSRGYNDILIWFAQSALDDPLDPGSYRVACVRAQYIAPDYKIPYEGEITLTDEDFVKPPELDLSFTDSSCVTSNEGN